ncbi:chlorohydrolase [Streptococcus pneumoniae]|nr:chlorohydrolase [Streptococcus pneumoniae]
MKIKEQTRKLASGCSKNCFEVVDETDEVSSKHCFEVVDELTKLTKSAQNIVLRLWMKTDEVTYARQGDVDVV